MLPHHVKIMQGMLDLKARRDDITAVGLKRLFETDKSLVEAGGVEYLKDLARRKVATDSAIGYAKVVRDCADRRAMIHVLSKGIEKAYDGATSRTAEMIRAEAEMNLGGLAQATYLEEDKEDPMDFIEERLRNPDKLLGVDTGITRLNDVTCGWQLTDLIVLAGRSSMGKTSLAVSTAVSCGVPVGFFSLEMSAREIKFKIISQISGVPSQAIRTGRHDSQDDIEYIRNAAEQLKSHKIPIYIDEAPGDRRSVPAIRARIREMQKIYGIKLVIIDQLTYVTPTDPKASTVDGLGEVMKGLKRAANDLKIPVIVLHQLSRAVEQRDDHRPKLPDLRDSGNIEQDADTVVMVYRPEYYLDREEKRDPFAGMSDDECRAALNDPITGNDVKKAAKERKAWEETLSKVRGLAEVIVAKQRMGPVGTVKCRFDGNTQRFSN